MAYKLKTTGIAQYCRMCIAVDPDTNTIKDFYSTAVTSTMTVGSGITIGEQAWNTNTRKFIQLAASNYIQFGDNKPNFTFTSTNSARTAVFIGQVAGGASSVFGSDSSNYFSGIDSSSGLYHPTFYCGSSAFHGSGGALTAGTKRIFGVSLQYGVSSGTFTYSSGDSDTTPVITSGTFDTSGAYYISYIGRWNASATQQNDKIHAVLIFNIALTQADFEALRADWFNLLLEQETVPNGETTGGIGVSISSGSGGTAAGVGSGDISITGGTGISTASGSGGDAVGLGGSGSFTSSPMYNAGVKQVSIAGAWTWYSGAIGAAPLSALVHGIATTNANGQVTATGLPAGVGFMLFKTDSGAIFYEAGTV